MVANEEAGTQTPSGKIRLSSHVDHLETLVGAERARLQATHQMAKHTSAEHICQDFEQWGRAKIVSTGT